MTLSEWAQKEGVTISKAYKLHNKGLIPFAVKTESGAILVFESEEEVLKFKETKPPFRREPNKEKHKYRMENDEEYRLAHKKWRKENRELAKTNGYVRKPWKTYKEFTPEQKAKHLIQTNKHRANNREKLNERRSELRNEKKAKDPLFLEKMREQSKKNAKRWPLNEEQKRRRASKIREWRANDKAKNPEKHKRRQREYVLNNPNTRKQTCRNYNNKPYVRLYQYNRGRLRNAILSGLEGERIGGVVGLFGCTKHQLVAHIESQFKDGMTWKNWGDVWQIDHILAINLSKGNKDLAVKLNHYTNLRPLCKYENMSKSDNFIPELWPKDFPYPPEDFGLDRKTIPFFNQTAEQGHALDSTQHSQESATTTPNQESYQTDQPISG